MCTEYSSYYLQGEFLFTATDNTISSWRVNIRFLGKLQFCCIFSMIQFSFLLLSHNSILKHNSRLSRLLPCTLPSFYILRRSTRLLAIVKHETLMSKTLLLWNQTCNICGRRKEKCFWKKRNIIVLAINLVGTQQEMSRGLVSHIYHVSYLHVNLLSRNTKYYYCKCSIRRNNESRRCFIIIFLSHLRGPASLKIMFSWLIFVTFKCVLERQTVYGDCSPFTIVLEMKRNNLFHASSVSCVHWWFNSSFKAYIRDSCIACGDEKLKTLTMIINLKGIEFCAYSLHRKIHVRMCLIKYSHLQCYVHSDYHSTCHTITRHKSKM